MIHVRYGDRDYVFRQVETGAQETLLGTGITSGKWDGFIELELLSEPGSNQELKDVLEAMTEDGFAGLIVGREALRFSEWRVKFYGLHEETGDGPVASIKVQYSTLRDNPKFAVQAVDEMHFIVRREG